MNPFPRRGILILILALCAGGNTRAVTSPAPELLLSLRGLQGESLESDLPLFVSVRIEAPAEEGARLTLAPGQGDWSDAVLVEITPATGSPLRARRIDPAKADPSVILDAEQAAEGTWLFSSADIARLARGDAQVQVKLTIPDGSGWKGAVASQALRVKIVAPTGSLTEASVNRRALALADEAMALDDFPKAARLLDERLAIDPDNIELLKQRAVLCLRGGNLAAANTCVNRAWNRVMRQRWTHPPSDLYELSEVIAQAMLGGPKAETATLPGWTKLPDNVNAPIRNPRDKT